MTLTTSAIHNPLAINLPRQIHRVLAGLPPDSPYVNALRDALPSNRGLLVVLSRLLAVPALTLTIASAFRPILLDMCARWLDDEENTEDQLAAICLLVEVHEELFAVLYKLLLKFAPEGGPLAFVHSAPSPLSIDVARLHRLLLVYYRILQANRELPGQLLWPLGPLSQLMWAPHLDNGVRLMALRCYALQSGMGEAEREKIEREVLGEACGVDCEVAYGEEKVDGWLLPVLESRRVKELRDRIARDECDFYARDEGEVVQHIQPEELSSLTVNVHGVLLLRTSGAQQASSPLIATPTAIDALRSLALHISMRLPTLLTSPPSSGKSMFLSHLAAILHPETRNQIITIHLADTSLDPRSLLGSYVSSPTQPGTFEWKEGVLVRSMREGKWVVFEDVDRGSSEVLGVIKPLIESLRLGKWIGGRAYLDVPSRGRVVAHDDFALFATRSVLPARNGTFATPVFFGAHKLYEVAVPSPSAEELRMIVEARFPRLSGRAAYAIIRLWDAVKALGSAASTRDVGVRELEKFCIRVDHLLPSSHRPMDVSDGDGIVSLSAIFPNPTFREDVYLEARDVFFGAGTLTASAHVHIESIARTIGEHLGLQAEQREWVLRGRTPEFDVERDVNGEALAVRVGRTRLPARVAKMEIAPPATRPFAMHRPAVLLLSRIATAVSLAEPVLLTGETGTGKTSVVTHLASLLRRPLISLNLSHQTESSDLLGGFKPVDARIPGSVLQGRFLELFGGTFSRRKNEKFEGEVRRAVLEGKWKRAVGLWRESTRLAKGRIHARQAEEAKMGTSPDVGAETPRKRRKVEQDVLNVSEASWSSFLHDVEEFEVQHVHGKGKFAFGFVEGPLVKALRSGDWVLLDEINLASPETLECISGLLHGPTASITLTEEGSLEPVPRHPDFRLFACMNPATDIGKKDLPPNIRSRFTEIDVPPPDADKETLLSIVNQYIGPNAVGDKGAIMNVAEFYSAVKELSEKRQIADGSNHRPHYSMRTLARALTFAADMASTYSLRRSIWEGCLMAFTMVLDPPSTEIVTALAQKHLLAGVRNPRSLLTKEPSVPHSRSADEFVKLGPFYLERGPVPQDLVDDYIMTPSVEAKLIDLARIVLTRRFPILIEGPTSSGKTSSVEYLAKRTGHRFVRINNHEHTDIQEYIGSYVSDPMTGKLVFKDGLLVRALRNGDWIVLDELNLAPTDVLEALNRLLDDNRELVIPETHEIVRPHPHFMLFATQNPPGLYAGRKVLSRAFRNRFLEVHFEDVPQAELETILCQRCRIAPSYGKRIVSVFRELQKRRQSGRVFESKQGFATLRDLFRWAGRDAVGYQELADNGYMLLAERARRDDDKVAVKEVIESIMGVKIDENALYNIHNTELDLSVFLGCPIPASSNLIWTKAMQRLYVLLARALRFNEPVLLVGETGSGKTSVCQVFADASAQHLHGLNCHQNTETADMIGGLRPVRNRGTSEAEAFREAATALDEVGITGITPTFDILASALNKALKSLADLTSTDRSRLQGAQQKLLRLQSIFEWYDGPLVEAMRNGDVFLLDEISLADDSVLERLNSVLEPARTIVLAERGGDDVQNSVIQAVDGFKLVATMNPGGDYGKKELSPALRNRFTEIWVPAVDDRHDLELIVGSLWKYEALKLHTNGVLDFVEWLCTRVGDRSLMGLRDILAWVVFTNSAYQPEDQDSMNVDELFHHAAHMTYLDGLASLPQLSAYSRDALRRVKEDALAKLQQLVSLVDRDTLSTSAPTYNPTTHLQLGSFAISRGPGALAPHAFNLQAPTTRDNAMRIIRACQVLKPILLEGSPGVGKTSLVTALANISGHNLCRINLSDQTDLIDLFGSDLPVEGGAPGEFAWKDAEFLKALQEGHWVLLDEMNLAPQAVLEGLNAVLDHRGTVYIPELGRSFVRHPSFRIFAAQNPLNQGGGRKGLPKSFVNRFTKVYIEELSPNDLFMVCQHVFPDFDEAAMRAMISFNMLLNDEIGIRRAFARDGSPWEFNLRDVIRWGTLLRTPGLVQHPAESLRSVYLHRFRTVQDRVQARLLFDKVFKMSSQHLERVPHWTISSEHVQIGHFFTGRKNLAPLSRPGRILKMQLSALESVGHCVSQSWLSILTGHRNSGKTDLVRGLANHTGNALREISVNSATDTMDILGSFEQVDIRGRVFALVEEVVSFLDTHLRSASGSKICHDKGRLLRTALREKSRSTPLHPLLRTASDVVAEMQSSNAGSLLVHQGLQGKIDTLLAVPDTVGRFEWVDGPLVQAIKHGHWLLMDGANLCNPSVLDRLNSLCEPGGFLTLSERGYVDGKVQVIKPHANFRLFMSVDPQYGELSRAMRNRGIEIALLGMPMADDTDSLWDYLRLPLSATGNQDPKAQILGFDAKRRGISSQIFSSPSTGGSSGRTLDQESALSSLVDHAPTLVVSSSVGISDAHLYFYARTAIPSYIPHFSRFLTTFRKGNDLRLIRMQALLEAFPSRQVAVTLELWRNAYSLLRGVPPAFVLAQPMDFYLNSPPCVDDSLESTIPSAHRIILQALDLAVALFLHDEDLDKSKKLKTNDHPEHSVRNQRASKAIASVLEAARAIGYATLESPEWKSVSQHLGLAFDILGYCRHLRKLAESEFFDFSAVQAVSRWMVDILEDCPPPFVTLAAHSLALSHAISLSSGLGLMDIWSTFFIDRPLQTASSDLVQLEDLACSWGESSTAYSLRRQTFDFMALRTLPTPFDHSEALAMAELKTSLERRLHGVHEDRAPTHERRIDPPSLIAELGILPLFGETSDIDVRKFLIRSMEEIVDLACQDFDAPLLRVVPHQHLIWAISAGKKVLPIIAQTQAQWLSALWNADETNGPLMLLQPAQLKATTLACDWSRNSMSSLRRYEANIHRHVRLAFLQCERDTPRIEQLTQLLYQSISIVASSFASSFNESVRNELGHLAARGTQGAAPSVDALLRLLEHSSNTPFTSAVRDILKPVCQRFSILPRTRRQTIVDLGLCWIALSRLILELFVPDAPIDPAAVQNFAFESWRQEEALISLQLSLHSQLERISTGNTDNNLLAHLQQRLDAIAAQISNAPVLPLRADVSRLHMFWSEIVQLQNNVIPRVKIDRLLVLLESGEEGAVLREKVVQQSIAGFCQRLDTVYTEYSDISAPLQLALLYLRLGLRFVAHSAAAGPEITSEAATTFSSALVAFPSVCGSAVLGIDSATMGPSSTTPFRHLLLRLSSVVMERSLGVDADAQSALIDTTYGQALRLWLIDRAKENEDNEASQSLYRRKNLDHDALGEAEMEEQEFLALFPSFEDALEQEVQSTERNVNPSFVQVRESLELLHLHYSLFHSSSSPDQPALALLSFNKIRKSTLESLLQDQTVSLSETLDVESLPLQLSMLRDRLSGLESKHNAAGIPYNFYVDANITEVKRAATAVAALKDRLEVLIGEWPDQMVLQHLHSRCGLVLNLDLHSPVAKIVSAFEQLLVQSEDWERYANRENSLKSHQQALTGLIVEWRRLELSSWQALLESQAKTFEEGVSDWWFRLYDASIRGPLDASDREHEGGPASLTQYLESLLPLLDDFLRSSPLGQFHARMRLLRSFDTCLLQLARTKLGHQRLALGRVRRVLHATGRYYDLFSIQLSAHLSEQKAVLEKEIRGFIKLASWRDVNVQALKQSAQRTHHQLYKIVRKFRDVLRQPISERLLPQFAGNPETKYLETELDTVDGAENPFNDVSFPDGNSGTASSSHLINLKRTFSKYRSLVVDRIHPSIRSRSAQIVDSLAVDIIVTAKELASISIPPQISAEKREPKQKALLVRKRKTWSDLLKELKRAGFAANMKPDVLRQQGDARWIREQPIMPTVAEMAISTEKVETYFTKLHGALPDLRAAVSSHHPDLTTRELQRGIMLLESGFSMAIDLRSRLAEAMAKFGKLEQISSRLRALVPTSNIALSGGKISGDVSHINDVICRLGSALREVLHGITTFNALRPTPSISSSFTEQIQVHCALTNVLREQLTIVMKKINLTSFAVVLNDEHTLILEVVQHFSRTAVALRQWSTSEPRLEHLFHPVEQWLASQEIPTLSPGPPALTPGNTADTLINTFLVSLQTIVTASPETVEDVTNEEDHYILKNYRAVREFTHFLNINTILTLLDGVLLHVTSHNDVAQQDLQRVLPFLDVYVKMVKEQLGSHTQWTKALFKLTFVLCSIMHTLVKEGFCKPHDEDTEAGGDASEASGGLGLGEGTGTENVSKDIEDESQVEGLQGEEPEKNDNKDTKAEEDAIEMSEDVGGDMEDVPDKGEEDEAESDEGSDVDPEEKMADLDPTDPSAIDEKMWGDEQGPQDENRQDDKTNQDRSEEKAGDSEVVAKEEKDQRQSKEKEKSVEKQPDEDATSEPEEEPVPETTEDETGDPNVSGAPMDEFVQDANTLDLPDDMDLGEEEEKPDGGAEEDEDYPMDGDEPEFNTDTMTEDRKEEADECPESNDEENKAPTRLEDGGEDEDVLEDDSPKEEGIAQPDVSAGDGAAPSNDAHDPEGGEAATSGETGSSGGVVGQDTTAEVKEGEKDGLPENGQQPLDPQSAESQTAGSATVGSREGQAPSQADDRTPTNPLRSLGDALKEIKQRFDEILEGEKTETPRENTGEAGAPSQVEYLQPEDADHDMQALGPAGEEQVAKLNELKLIDEDEKVDDAAAMDVDLPLVDEDHHQPSRDKAPGADPTAMELHEDVEGAILQGARPVTNDSTVVPDLLNKADVEMEEESDQDVEAQLRQWKAAGWADDQAEHIWRLYESLTHDLAYALCEQLRLILEPTLATRLKGDYRTGKRLNMKKIISYIASDFTKDKIWLRRTRPSQREYQVLIALDDSRSMAESHSTHLAYETLALVTKALSRLEAGDIAIAKFGETVDVLHGFDEGPFTDQAGTKVVNAFRFNQKATDMLSLVETSLRVLEAARERRSMSSSSAADLWQLEIIISDGMCQDHDRLRTVLRKAEEQRVMIVFIIIDSLQSTASGSTVPGPSGSAQGSILSMDKAEFKNINGRMELQLQRYLDSFPFQYYVILRSVEALPEVLSGTLKQFFERISEE